MLFLYNYSWFLFIILSFAVDVTINLMQGYHDLDATVHITHRFPHTITIQAHKDEEVHMVSIEP